MDVRKKFEALAGKEDTVVLGIESSCDETAAAVYAGGRILSNVISSQIEIHRRFGGVVPEIASRNHTLALPAVADEALKEAGMSLKDVDAIGVTYGAGLIGALLVGVSSAKALAYAANKPLIKVNHIEAHICANYIEHKELSPPFLALVASGGHTSIVEVEGYNRYKLVGSTTDDAIGEAFDKVARLIGLGYPGGPNVDRLARLGSPVIDFCKKKKPHEFGKLSYSGLKTAVVNYVHNARQKGETLPIEDICASFTAAAIEPLVDTVVEAARRSGAKTVVIAGGVASNSALREEMRKAGEKNGFKVLMPSPVYCTDNAAMVAVRAFFSAREGVNLAGLDLGPESNLRI